MELGDRYARHRLIDGWDQARLSRARVMVAGAGAIGNEVIKLLALMGFGQIVIVDFDFVETSNLTRSLLFRESDVGRPKANVAAERAREINPEITVVALNGDLRFDVGLDLVRSMDLIIGCLDSLDARLAVNRAAMKTRVPWLNGAIEMSVAEVSLFRAGEGACFECAMSSSMWERRNERYSCTGLRSLTPERAMPTTAIVAGLAAAYLVQEALSLLRADGSPEKEGLRSSQKITINLQPYETAVFALPKNPDCLAHESLEPIEPALDLPLSASLRDLLEATGSVSGVVELGFDLVTEMRCAECGASEPVLLPLERCDESLVGCTQCGRMSRHPETVNWLDAGHPLSGSTLAELGIPEHQIVCIKEGGSRKYFPLGSPVQEDRCHPPCL